METMNIRFNGTTALLMHSVAIAINPTHPLSIAIKKNQSITAKKRTDEHAIELMRLKWMQSIYHDDQIGPFIPAENVEATIRMAAQKRRKGKDVTCGLFVSPDRIPLIFDGPRDIDSLYADERFRDVRNARIPSSKAAILVSRPRFNHWRIDFSLEYDPEILNRHEIADFCTYAGVYVGLCDYRPRYGRFESVVL